MKKFIFSIFLFLSIVSSTFAGSDTDAICSDTNQLGLINKNIKVEYPTNEILIESVRKAYTAKGNSVLYYVVNVLSNTKVDPYMGKYTERAELYSYTCNTKKPKLLASYLIDAVAEWYTIDQVVQENIILRKFESAADEGGASEISVYSTKINKVLFTIKNNDLFYHTNVSGFANGKGAWYLYFSSPGISDIQKQLADSAIFRIDKKTKKVTKL